MNQDPNQRHGGDPKPDRRADPAQQSEKPADERLDSPRSGEGAETALKRMRQQERSRASAFAGGARAS